MKISQLLEELTKAMTAHGDLPVFTWDSDVGAVRLHPARDGIEVTPLGEGDAPNELIIEFVPAD